MGVSASRGELSEWVRELQRSSCFFSLTVRVCFRLKDDAKLVHLLLQRGANPNVRDMNGWTPLTVAGVCCSSLSFLVRTRVCVGRHVRERDVCVCVCVCVGESSRERAQERERVCRRVSE
jgi:Ankyrin repeat